MASDGRQQGVLLGFEPRQAHCRHTEGSKQPPVLVRPVAWRRRTRLGGSVSAPVRASVTRAGPVAMLIHLRGRERVRHPGHGRRGPSRVSVVVVAGGGVTRVPISGRAMWRTISQSTSESSCARQVSARERRAGVGGCRFSAVARWRGGAEAAGRAGSHRSCRCRACWGASWASHEREGAAHLGESVLGHLMERDLAAEPAALAIEDGALREVEGAVLPRAPAPGQQHSASTRGGGKRVSPR